MHVRKHDIVQVMAGDEKGKRGRVLKVLPDKGKIVVEGVAFVYKHLRRGRRQPEGGRIQKEAPISASNVMLVCPACGKTTRPRHARSPDGQKFRACTREKCGEFIVYEKKK